MVEDNSKSLDILGIKPIADSLKIITQGAIEGASAFLSRICLPACEEFGLLLRDKVANWRNKNRVTILQQAEKMLASHPDADKKHAHPRLIAAILEQGSWIDNEEVQNMWAGLLASSCSEDGKDDTNMLFINILSQMTSLEAIILNKACQIAKKYVTRVGWVAAMPQRFGLDKLTQITGISDFYRLDRELDHLRSLGLISLGFHPESLIADVTPTTLALQLYVRCQGYIGSPVEFFDLSQPQESDPPSS